MNSIIGSQVAKWVLGILNQREDGNYYLEDSTLAVKVSFSQLERVDPDSFFTEGSLVLCRGIHHDECLYILDLQQPPLHARKSFIFKVNEADYFGGYTKQKQILAQVKVSSSSTGDRQDGGLAGSALNTKVRPLQADSALPPPDQCIVVLS